MISEAARFNCMTHSLLNLIQTITSLRKQYDRVAQATGEKFNIFKVLNLATNETRTHSAFLAELLDPNGSHGKGPIFLKLFLSQAGITGFDCETAEVAIERPTGKIDEDYLTGGRVDILIHDNYGRGIIIENKIHARDQKNQILRYYAFAKDNFSRQFWVVYLNLQGQYPTLWSIGNGQNFQREVSQDLYCISYRHHIIEWLTLCLKELVSHPLLRETVTQYINLLKELTGQTMTNQLTEEVLREILRGGGESIKGVCEITNTIYPALVKNLRIKLKDQVKALRITPEFNLVIDEDLGANGTGFYLVKLQWSLIKIGFEFETDGLFYGVRVVDEGTPVTDELKLNLLSRLGPNGGNPTRAWPWWRWLYQPRDFQIYENIYNGLLIDRVSKLVADFDEKLNGLEL